MPTHASLTAHLDAVAATRPAFDTADWLSGVGQYLREHLDPRLLIDTPSERAALEVEAVAGFDRLVRPAMVKRFGEIVANGFLSAIEPELVKLLEVLFVSLAATLPTPTPQPTNL